MKTNSTTDTDNEELLSTLRLIRTKNVGPYAFFEAIRLFGSAKNAMAYIPNILAKRSKGTITLHPLEAAEKELEECNKLGVKLITYTDIAYPSLLAQLGPGRPPLLSCIGNISLLSRPSVAVVGSRRASLTGLMLTEDIAHGLGNLGLIVTSGMAHGIDAAAHKATLETGTIAVLGCGVNKVFPKQNYDLYHKIAAQGLLVSTFPLHAQPTTYNFPLRNQYIAALTWGTVVVEAKLKSGSIITASHAAQYGREVFAVPGNPHDANSEGCNRLLKNGAVLIERASDMVPYIRKWQADLSYLKEESYNTFKGPQAEIPETLFAESSKLQQALLPLISHTPVSLDFLQAQFSGQEKILSLAILELELVGSIQRVAGNKIMLLANPST